MDKQAAKEDVVEEVDPAFLTMPFCSHQARTAAMEVEVVQAAMAAEAAAVPVGRPVVSMKPLSPEPLLPVTCLR